MPVDLSTIGGRLRRARIAAGLSQIGVAQKLGVTQGTISRVEAGRDSRVTTLVEMARALDFDLTLVPRRLRATVERLVDGGPSDHTAVYTGAGDEPYYEGEPDDREESTLARISPQNLPRYPSPRTRARGRRGNSEAST